MYVLQSEQAAAQAYGFAKQASYQCSQVWAYFYQDCSPHEYGIVVVITAMCWINF